MITPFFAGALVGILIGFFIGIVAICLLSPIKNLQQYSSYELDKLEEALNKSRKFARYWADEHMKVSILLSDFSDRHARAREAITQISALVQTCDLMSIKQICDMIIEDRVPGAEVSDNGEVQNG